MSFLKAPPGLLIHSEMKIKVNVFNQPWKEKFHAALSVHPQDLSVRQRSGHCIARFSFFIDCWWLLFLFRLPVKGMSRFFFSHIVRAALCGLTLPKVMHSCLVALTRTLARISSQVASQRCTADCSTPAVFTVGLHLPRQTSPAHTPGLTPPHTLSLGLWNCTEPAFSCLWMGSCSQADKMTQSVDDARRSD